MQGWKDTLYKHYTRIEKARGLIMLALLIGQNALLVADLVAWRGLSPRVTVPVVGVGLGLLVLVVANVWVVGLGTYKAERRAATQLNPLAVYQMRPWQEMEIRTKRIPELEGLAAMAEANGCDEEAEQLRASAERFRRWVEKGYIPKEDMPEHLHRFYLGEGEPL